jgi:hypothetical protein
MLPVEDVTRSRRAAWAFADSLGHAFARVSNSEVISTWDVVDLSLELNFDRTVGQL